MEVVKTDKSPLSVIEETRIVALLARGDNYDEIKADILKHHGRSIAKNTITKVKRRNEENLRLIAQRVLENEQAQALKIKQKANKLIESRLSKSEQDDDILAQATERYRLGEIDDKEYNRIKHSIHKTSIPELVSVSREMHEQSKDDAAPENTVQKDLHALVEAIQSGDPVVISQMIFNDKSQTPTG